MGRLTVILILFLVVVVPVWLVFHFIVGRTRERVIQKKRGSLTAELARANQEMTTLEVKLRALESYVTSSEFQLHKAFSEIDR